MTPLARRSSPLPTLLVHAAIIVLALAMLTPLLWVLAASVKTGRDQFAYAFLPWDAIGRVTWDNYATLFARQPVSRWLANSVVLSSINTFLVVVLSSMGGFALAKYDFVGKRLALAVMLATVLLPGQVLLPSSFELVHALGWMDSYLAIVVPGSISVFGVFLYRQAMTQVPEELLNAARVDGCSELRLWWDVAMPVVRPMTGAFTLMSFLASWNAFLWPQIVLQDERKYTLPIGISGLMGMPEYQQNFGLLMAATVVSVAPVVLLFFVLQKDFVAGLTSGAVKG